MELNFDVSNREILRTPYFSDFFFEKIDIFITTDRQKEYKLLQSAVHGRFLIDLGEALIDLMQNDDTKSIKSIGGPFTYEISSNSDDFKIKIIQRHELMQEYIYSKEKFIVAVAKECKNYLETIKKANPRIVLEDQYQLIASCFLYFDRLTTLENNRHIL